MTVAAKFHFVDDFPMAPVQAAPTGGAEVRVEADKFRDSPVRAEEVHDHFGDLRELCYHS